METRYLWGVAAARVRRANSGKATSEETAQELYGLCRRMAALGPHELTLISSKRPRGAAAPLVWHACQKCAAGDIVELEPAERPLVCRKHQSWVGPGVALKRQLPGRPVLPAAYHSQFVCHAVLDTAVRLDGLIASGQANWRLVNEVFSRISSAKRCRYRGAPAPSDLPLAVELVEVLTDLGLHQKLLDTEVTFRQGYQILAEVISSKAPQVSWAVIDQAWLLLRPAFVWYRTTQLGDKGTGSFEPLLGTRLDGRTANYPLEPMWRYLDCLRTRNRSDDQWWNDRFAVPLADPKAEKLLLCTRGHVQSRRKAKARRAGDDEFHCSICSGQRIVPGYNSLGDVLPQFALEWDQDANGDLTPYMIGPGYNGKVGWKDQLGHHYEAYVTNRTIHGTGCRFCASKGVLAGYNDLATTHPELAAMWDYEANGDLKPTAVSAGNATTVVHLRCPNGHRFSRKPAKLIEAGGSCQECNGKVLISGTNDLSTVRPDVAAWWNWAKNEPLTPDKIKPGSENTVWWVCPRGHAFPSTPSYMCSQEKISCPVESGRRLVQGESDLATKEPELIKDWDREKMGAALKLLSLARASGHGPVDTATRRNVAW
jgi:hypothetical protein